MIGANGAGKTTLFRMITGQEKPDAGKLTVGPTVELAYVDQTRDALDRRHRLRGDHRRHATSSDRRSGGERPGVRGVVQLQGRRPAEEGRRRSRRRAQPGAPGQDAAQGGNVLLLDEPTNDLDVDTLRALEEALLAFAGCAVVISHDRWFLDRIATHVLAFEGDSQVLWFEGNFTEYEAVRRKELGVDVDQPHRLRYKRLIRE